MISDFCSWTLEKVVAKCQVNVPSREVVASQVYCIGTVTVFCLPILFLKGFDSLDKSNTCRNMWHKSIRQVKWMNQFLWYSQFKCRTSRDMALSLYPLNCLYRSIASRVHIGEINFTINKSKQWLTGPRAVLDVTWNSYKSRKKSSLQQSCP